MCGLTGLTTPLDRGRCAEVSRKLFDSFSASAAHVAERAAPQQVRSGDVRIDARGLSIAGARERAAAAAGRFELPAGGDLRG